MFKRISMAVGLAAKVVLAAPVKLPPKVRVVAQCVVLAIGLLDDLVGKDDPEDVDASAEGRADGD